MVDKPAPMVPSLRFPEFRDAGEWEPRKLGEIANFFKGKGLPKSMLSNDGKSKCIHYGELFTTYPEIIRTVSSRTDLDQNLFLSTEDDVLMPTSDVTPSGLAKACCVKLRDVIIGGDILVVRTDQQRVDGEFLARYIRRLEQRVLQLITGSTVYHLYASSLEKLDLWVPKKPEQQKIADCLGSLDDLIAAQDRKLAALRKHKLGLMQQLFPQPGETVPRLRFPEFKDAPEWEVRALKDVCEILNYRRIPITSSGRRPGPYPYYGASGIVDYVDEYIFDERLVLVGEDGAKWGAFEPTAFVAEGKCWVNNHAHVLRPYASTHTLLANYLTMIDLGKFVTGAAPPKLTLGKLKTIPIPLSPLSEEHEAIASCLAILDQQFAEEVKKHEALKTHKKGLMQQIFPDPETK